MIFGFLSQAQRTGLGATIAADAFAGTTCIALVFGVVFFALGDDAATGFLATFTVFLTIGFFAATFLVLLFAGVSLTAFFTATFLIAGLVTFTVDFLGAAFFLVSFFFVTAILTSS